MAFMGIFLLSWFVLMFFLIIFAVILFVFVPCLIIFIINIVKGAQSKWPKKHLVPAIITGVVLSVLITIAFGLALFIVLIREGSGYGDSSSAQAAIALHYYLQLIIY